MNRHKTKAFTLTEAAIVLGLIGLVLTAVWVAVYSVYLNQRISTTVKQITEIVQKTRALHGITPGLMLDMAIQGEEGALTMASIGAIPRDMMDRPENPTAIQNLWQGAVSFSALNTDRAGDSFTLSFEDVPKEPCSSILVGLTGRDRDRGLIAAGTATDIQAEADMPIDIVTAVGDCSGDTNTLILTFMLK